MKLYDLAIVGGGPSGSSAAYIACQHGLDTIVIDSKEFPREKACGGALSEQAVSYLPFEVPRSIREKDVYGARVTYGDTTIEVKLGFKIASIVTRSKFDHFLVQKAESVGSLFLFGESVFAVDCSKSHIVLKTHCC